jgi:hypothetical protein
MTREQIKAAVLSLEKNEQKQLIMELLPEILPKVCTDTVCIDSIRKFVDEESIRTYREQHMDGI